MEERIVSALELFRVYVGEKDNSIDESLLKVGIIIPESAPSTVKSLAEGLYSIDHKKLNSTFHKDYYTMATGNPMALIMQQLMNYVTTYGFEALGMPADAYVPNEEFDVVEVVKAFTIISPVTEEELKDKVVSLAKSGIALTKKSLNCLENFLDYLPDVKEIKNRELKIIWYSKNNKVPSDPEEFLRYVIYKAIGSTLKIKSPEIIQAIGGLAANKYETYFLQYEKDNTLVPLAKIWYRNKPLFLAFKRPGDMARIVNKVRKLAYKYHEPMRNDLLIPKMTTRWFEGEDWDKFRKELSNVTTYKLFALYNLMSFRETNPKSDIYRIRNGKSYLKDYKLGATEEELNKQKEEGIIDQKLYNLIQAINERSADDKANKKDCIMGEIKNRINFDGKKFYVPENINYGLPTSEKAYVGSVPDQTKILLPHEDSNLVVGIHWYNVNDRRTDLDLHACDKTGARYGWNQDWMDESAKDVVFTGDMTDAPNGASEYYYISNNYKEDILLSVTDFTSNGEVPYELIVAEADHVPSAEKKRVIDPNKILFKTSLTVIRTGTIGRISFEEGKIKVTLSSQGIDNGIAGLKSEYATKAMNIMEEKANVSLTLNDLIKECGGVIVNAKDDDVIDLSLDKIAKDTFIDLLSDKKGK